MGAHWIQSIVPVKPAETLTTTIVVQATVRGQPFAFFTSVAATLVLASEDTAMEMVDARASARLDDRNEDVRAAVVAIKYLPAPWPTANAQVSVSASKRS